MNKIVIGLLLGGVLGIFDGLTAWFTPAARPMMVGIVIGSTIKGMIAGIAAGWFARRVQSVPKGIAFGFAVGLLLAFLVAAMPSETGEHYYFEIMLPGSILGAVVGWATQRYGKPATASPRVASVAVALVLSFAMSAGAAESITAKEALEKLKSLKGTWSGPIMKTDGPEATFEYRVSAGGTAVIETLFAGTPHEMVTVYSVEGKDLIATHYCSAGNQPTMKMVNGTPEQLDFGFVSVHGEHADKGHIHKGWIRFAGENKIEGQWISSDEKPTSIPKKFWLTRK